jgi:hypothetical protein
MGRTSSMFRRVRRIRALRRRRLQLLLDDLGRRIRYAWMGPVRRSVAWQLDRLAQAVERSTDAAERIVASETRLSRELERLADLPRHRTTFVGGQPRPSVVPGSAAVGVVLLLGAGALVAGNTWLLDTHLLPPVATSQLPGAALAQGPWLAAAFSTLAVLLGIFHFALFTVGRSAALRLLGVAAGLLLMAQAALQAGATIVAVQAWAGNVTGSWAGIGAIALLAGSAGLVPPVIAAMTHAALDRFARWTAGREQRVAARAGVAQDRLRARLDRAIHEVTDGLATVRESSRGIPEGDPARLLVRPEPAPSVERLANVLRRLAVAVERDPATEMAPPTTVMFQHALGLGALLLWMLAAGATVAIAGRAGGALRDAGQSGLVAFGLMAAVAALLVGGLVLRLMLERPERRTAGVTGAAGLILLGLGIAAIAMGLGPLATRAGSLPVDPFSAAAILYFLVLAAALGSARLPEGVRTGVAILRSAILGVAWLAVGLADLVLAGVDRLLVGRRHRRRPARARRPRRPQAQPMVGAIGGRQEPR